MLIGYLDFFSFPLFPVQPERWFNFCIFPFLLFLSRCILSILYADYYFFFLTVLTGLINSVNETKWLVIGEGSDRGVLKALSCYPTSTWKKCMHVLKLHQPGCTVSRCNKGLTLIHKQMKISPCLKPYAWLCIIFALKRDDLHSSQNAAVQGVVSLHMLHRVVSLLNIIIMCH